MLLSSGRKSPGLQGQRAAERAAGAGASRRTSAQGQQNIREEPARKILGSPRSPQEGQYSYVPNGDGVLHLAWQHIFPRPWEYWV